MIKLGKLLLLIFVMTVCYALMLRAQMPGETEVPIQKESGSRNFRCYSLHNAVYDEQNFKELAKDENCQQTKGLQVDFTRQTLIGYRIGGDCFILGDAAVFRNDSTKTYQVRVKNYWGGCRAGGWFSGWLVVDKIPEDYKVEFSELKVVRLETLLKGKFKDLSPKKDNSEILESREIDLKGCIQTIFTNQFVITDEAAYLKTIRHDASRDACLKNLEKIDFTKNSLLGLEINSGYCDRPSGLEFQVIKDESAKNYLFNIGYNDPKNAVCRAFSQYDLWVIVPKIPDEFKVKFNVEAK